VRTCGRVDEVCTGDRSATPDATLVVVVDPHEEELVIEASAACENTRRRVTRQLQLACPDILVTTSKLP